MNRFFAVAVCLFGVCGSLLADPAESFQIKLASKDGVYLSAQRNKPLEASGRKTTFRILPGLYGTDTVSLEVVGAKNFYVRHENYIVYAHERPKPTTPQFDGDSSFKKVDAGEGKVYFEPVSFSGWRITAKDDGSVALTKDGDDSKTVFVLVKK